MIDAGHKLIAAKAALAHGPWLPFLCRVGIHERKARRFMRLAASGLKSDSVSDLGRMKAALMWLPLRYEFLKLQLPAIGRVLVGISGNDRAWIWADPAHPGFFSAAWWHHAASDFGVSRNPLRWATEIPGMVL
jgi:hypothetical protein